MNSLTKVLLEDLLEADKKKVTAIYGGGFKPPTKGHYAVVEKAAEQDPEIDDIIIYVGGGERDGITQAESIQVWEIYKKYLPLKTQIEPVKAPVGDILRYAKEHPEEEVLWIIGARENNPEDFADIASRTRTIDKYPNLQLRVIQTSGGVSGTAARKAVRDNNKEQFFHLIPDIPEKEQVWDIVSPVIKEGFVDDLKSKFNKFITAAKQEGKETKEAVSLLIKSAKGDIDLTDEQKKQIGEQLKDVLKLIGLTAIATLPGGFIAAALIKLFKAEYLVTPSSMLGTNEGTCGYDTNVSTGKKLDTPGGLEEADPKKGTGKKPEGSGRRLYTDEDPKDTVRIKFKTKEDIVDTLNKTSFKAKSHARQSQVINLIHQRVRAAYGKAKDPEVKARLKRALDYIEGRKEASKKKTERLRKMKEASDPQAGTALPYGSGFAPVKELVTDTEIICDNCGWKWAIKDGGNDLYICHKCGHDNTPNQLNEGRYDSISRQLAKLTLNYWKEGFAKGKNEINYIDRITPDEYPTDLEFLYNGEVIFTPSGDKYSHNGYAMSRGESKDGTPRVGVNYFVPKDMIPQGWEEIYMDLITTLRHEIEHLTQSGGNVKQGKEMGSDMKLRKLIGTNKDVVRYVLLPKEVDANVQGLYLKAKKWRRPYVEVVDEWIKDFLKIKKQSDIDLIKGIYDKRAKELNLPAIQENDPFGIKAYARELVNEALKDTWNPEESFVSLSKFMIDNGMNIKPLPKIKVIKDDKENASNLLGKTAYYDPNNKSITLFTMDRHPKDILRSFSHEMVHHEQNLNGKLNNINTTNTNEDGDLPEIEREAYEKGNIMLRNWEDTIKNV
jgi:hypothetical protein